MNPFDRRQFLHASGGLAAALAAGPALVRGQQPPAPPKAKADDGTPFAPDTLFLTWQRDPTTTMTIQWIGEASKTPEPVIRYASRAAGDWTGRADPVRTPFPVVGRFVLRPEAIDLSVYRAELTGLTPGTEYEFQIGLNSPIYRFRTMPAKLTKSFTFVSGGDCGVNSHAVANNIMAAKQDPMFCLIGGDLGYDNGTSATTAIQFIRNYSRTMIDGRGRLIPLVVCIGNHEVAGGYGKPRGHAPFFFALFDGLYKETSYAALDFGDYLSLVLLDTGHVSPVGGEQADWLGKTLAARAEKPHLIAVNHVPAYPSYRAADVADPKKGGTGDENRKHWVPLFEKHMVDAVLEHHDHTFKRTHPLLGGAVSQQGIVYLGDGSWGRLRIPKSPEARPYLAATGLAYHMTIHRLEGEQRFHMAMEEGGRIVDVCRTGKRLRRRG